VLGVPRIGANLRVDSRRAKAQRRVRRIVVAMNQVMDQPRVIAMIYPGLLEHAAARM